MGSDKTTFKIMFDDSDKEYILELDDMYSMQKCRDNPKSLYIFGENVEQASRGTDGPGGGQAIIRGQKNAFGLCTLHAIGNYFNDNQLFRNMDQIGSDIETIENRLISVGYNTLVMPKYGLGTGRANLLNAAPLTFFYLCRELYKSFKYNNIKYLTIPQY